MTGSGQKNEVFGGDMNERLGINLKEAEWLCERCKSNGDCYFQARGTQFGCERITDIQNILMSKEYTSQD